MEDETKEQDFTALAVTVCQGVSTEELESITRNGGIKRLIEEIFELSTMLAPYIKQAVLDKQRRGCRQSVKC